MIASAIQHVVVDAVDPQLVATFWSRVLDRPIEDDWGDFVRLAPDAAGARLAFAAVPEAKSTKNRVHLDLAAPDREEATTALVELGATVVDTRTRDGHTWTVLTDPEGNEFCLA